MPFNPLRLVTSLWGRPHPTTTDSIDVSTPSDSEAAAYPVAQGTEGFNRQHGQKRNTSTTTSIASQGTPTTASSANIASTHLEDPFADEDEPVHSDDETVKDDDASGQRHTRRSSLASDVTLDHMGHANKQHEHGSKQRPAQCHEEKVSEVSLDERRKRIPKSHRDRRLKTPSSQPHDFTEDMVVEESTDDDPLPDGYLYTFRGVRFVKPSMKKVGTCGAEASLHKLVCGHWISTSARQPCGVNCDVPSFDHEAFRCAECCAIVHKILNTHLTAAETVKLARAKSGFHAFYIALAVEYVTNHATTPGGVTEAVINALHGYGRSCAPSAGPGDYDVDMEHTMRDLRQQEKSKHFRAKSPLTRHEKRSLSEEELGDALSLAMRRRQKKKKQTAPRRHTTPPTRAPHGRTRTSAPSPPSPSSSNNRIENEPETETAYESTPSTSARQHGFLHGGATTSPHFPKTADRLPKRRRQDEEQTQAPGKRRRVFKGLVWHERGV